MKSCFDQFGHGFDHFLKRFRSGIDQKWSPVLVSLNTDLIAFWKGLGVVSTRNEFLFWLVWTRIWSLSEINLSNNITHTNRFRVISIKSDTVLENYHVTEAFCVVENYKNRDFPEPSWLHNQRFIFVGTFTNTQISDFSEKATRLVLTSLTILNWFSFFTQNCGFALRQNGSDIFFTKEKCF